MISHPPQCEYIMVFLFLRESTLEDVWREALEDIRNLISSNYDNIPLSSTLYMSHTILEVQIQDYSPSAHSMRIRLIIWFNLVSEDVTSPELMISETHVNWEFFTPCLLTSECQLLSRFNAVQW